MNNQNRQPCGVPSGGQFVASARAEAAVELGETRSCFACGHQHDPNSSGACWEAACQPGCSNCVERGPVPLAAPRVGVPQVTRNAEGLVEVRSFACEHHDAPGSCTPECTALVEAMSYDIRVEYEETGTSYGPDRPTTAFHFDESECASVEVTTCPEGQTLARAVQPGEFVIVDGEAREVDRVSVADNRCRVTIEFASFDREPDGTPSFFLGREFNASDVFELTDGWDDTSPR